MPPPAIPHKQSSPLLQFSNADAVVEDQNDDVYEVKRIKDKHGRNSVLVSSRMTLKLIRYSAMAENKTVPPVSPTTPPRHDHDHTLAVTNGIATAIEVQTRVQQNRDEFVRCRLAALSKLATTGFASCGRGLVLIIKPTGVSDARGVFQFTSYRCATGEFGLQELDGIDMDNLFSSTVQCIRDYDPTKEFVLLYNMGSVFLTSTMPIEPVPSTPIINNAGIPHQPPPKKRLRASPPPAPRARTSDTDEEQEEECVMGRAYWQRHKSSPTASSSDTSDVLAGANALDKLASTINAHEQHVLRLGFTPSTMPYPVRAKSKTHRGASSRKPITIEHNAMEHASPTTKLAH